MSAAPDYRPRYAKKDDPALYSMICPDCMKRFGEHNQGWLEIKSCGCVKKVKKKRRL
jgi:hypothetical protein